MRDPACGGDVVVQIRRARERLAELETRAIVAAEYDHATRLHRAGAALDKVLEAADQRVEAAERRLNAAERRLDALAALRC